MKKAIIHQHYPLDYAGEEALNSICTNLAFIGTDKRKIVITSNSQSEGKSWMTMHIAENMARRGRHVVLVDADMRRSFMVQRYKLELEGEGLGLAHFLAGQCDLNDVVYDNLETGHIEAVHPKADAGGAGTVLRHGDCGRAAGWHGD